jgi:hypothetical protein
MSTKRLVKWSKESKEFFEKAEDKSVELTFNGIASKRKPDRGRF